MGRKKIDNSNESINAYLFQKKGSKHLFAILHDVEVPGNKYAIYKIMLNDKGFIIPVEEKAVPASEIEKYLFNYAPASDEMVEVLGHKEIGRTAYQNHLDLKGFLKRDN